ncbi:phage recombination protein Bet [Pasteurellaceae bacterium HPA106]|uniref:phage recombination protein Bet n=1 Tax=Spirabiliibacterium pneumoniae TaxID=221400 RepID=UPI001AAD542E|nr:phage recombination protein Bet [Spirabiliibacterium pneumoniae]MBE2895747.1 phage recombination protein Bet [Spirabiliibacterium pneumoniae]
MINLPANISTELQQKGISESTWSALKNSIFIGARDESIMMAIDYCKARSLDILKKPCHIVPMPAGRDRDGKAIYRDTVMPSIYEHRTTAFRTGQMAGQDDPVFGDDIQYLGHTVPSWCKVTVYRFINGQRCAFSHTEFFEEACGTKSERGRDGSYSKVLNSMWSKRPRGQLAKCAEAGALRKAFPDEIGGVISMEEVNTEEVTDFNKPEAQSQSTESTSQFEDKIEIINKLLEETHYDMNKLLKKCKVESITEISPKTADFIINTLSAYKNRMAENIVDVKPDEDGTYTEEL